MKVSLTELSQHGQFLLLRSTLRKEGLERRGRIRLCMCGKDSHQPLAMLANLQTHVFSRLIVFSQPRGAIEPRLKLLQDFIPPVHGQSFQIFHRTYTKWATIRNQMATPPTTVLGTELHGYSRDGLRTVITQLQRRHKEAKLLSVTTSFRSRLTS